MSKTTIPRGGITADAIDATLIADDAISEEHIDATVITGSTALAAEPADTDEFLISDAGTIKRIDYSHIKGGGTLVKTGQTTLSSNTSAVTVDNCFTSDYGNYLVILEDITNTVDSQGLRLRLRTGGSSGSTDNASQYRYASRYFQDNGGSDSNTGIDAQQFVIATNGEEDASWKGFCGMLTFYQPQENSSTRYTGNGSFIQNDKTNFAAAYLAGHYDSDAIHTGIHLYYSSGDVRAGANVVVYGISEA